MRFILLGLLLAVAGCQGQQAFPESQGDTSQNSLDWSGLYRGVIPCADCPGIDLTVRLMQNGTYELSTTHVGKSQSPASTRGRFRWRPGGSEIEFDARDGFRRFRVEENRLRVLDMRGGIVQGALADKYILRKVGN